MSGLIFGLWLLVGICLAVITLVAAGSVDDAYDALPSVPKS